MRTIMFNMQPWCTCIQSGKWLRQDGYRRYIDHPYKDLPNIDLWVHSRCNKPSKMSYDRLILGKQPLVENRSLRWEDDIAKYELYLDAKKIIDEELDWDEDEEDEVWEDFAYEETD